MTVDRASAAGKHRPPIPLEIAAVEHFSQRPPIHIKVGLAGHFPRAADPGTSCRGGTSSPGPMGRGFAIHRREKEHGGRGVATPLF